MVIFIETHNYRQMTQLCRHTCLTAKKVENMMLLIHPTPIRGISRGESCRRGGNETWYAETRDPRLPYGADRMILAVLV